MTGSNQLFYLGAVCESAIYPGIYIITVDDNSNGAPLTFFTINLNSLQVSHALIHLKPYPALHELLYIEEPLVRYPDQRFTEIKVYYVMVTVITYRLIQSPAEGQKIIEATPIFGEAMLCFMSKFRLL